MFKIGGAISQAKGAFSSWWSNLLVSPEPIQKAVEALSENGVEVEDDVSQSTQNVDVVDASVGSDGRKVREVHTV